MASKITDIECLCGFLVVLGDLRDTLAGLVDSAVAALQVVKAAIALVPENPEDVLQKLALETALSILNALAAPIETPIISLSNSLRAFSDCPPVATFANNAMEEVKKYTGLETLEELRFALDEKIDALNTQGLKLEKLDAAIVTLQDFKAALQDCSELVNGA